jgi:predicted neutral ceramidase superfamily lipid hydrolase
MRSLLRRCCESKRECITYVVMLLWMAMGILAFFYETDFTNLSAYFLALTGFVMSFIFGESYRKSSDSSIFVGGSTSKRELVTYITMLLWTAIGVWGIIARQDLIGLSAYFAALTPFVGSYVIGQSVRGEGSTEHGETQQLNS